MITLQRTNNENSDFLKLVERLDTELAVRDGEEHKFYAQFNYVEGIRHVVLAYEGETPIGCGAIKAYDGRTMEVKRMYTVPEGRGKGVGTRILAELENWSRELGNSRCILETGKKQPEAVDLYRKNGYKSIPNYDQYKGVENSLCFEKIL